MKFERLNVMKMIGNWPLSQFCLVSLLCVLGLPNVFSQTLQPPSWKCIQTVGNDVVLNWNPVNDPGNNFVSYDIYSNQDGLLSSITNINTTSFTDVNVGSVKDYYIKIVDNTGSTDGGINQNVRLNLTNPSDGTALLTWNTPALNVSNPTSNQLYIEREYPAGTWTVLDTLSFGQTFFKDTIDICSAFLNYRILYPGDGCLSSSNIVGDDFEDKITPSMPVISGVSIDTLTKQVQISWNQNAQSDTYGYVIYKMNSSGILVAIDTVYGWANTFYSYTENTSTGALTYSIAAFDSCFTQTIPQTYQTSAKSATHTTIFLTGEFNQCLSSVLLNWSSYIGWTGSQKYEVYATDADSNWVLQATTTNTAAKITLSSGGIFSFVIKGISADSVECFSNIIQIQAATSGVPSVHYFVAASVEHDFVHLQSLTDPNSNVAFIAFDRMDNSGQFNEIGRVSVNGNFIVEMKDTDVNLDKVNRYRSVAIDSCGNRSLISNTVETIFLQVDSDKENYRTNLVWTPYVGFDGGVESYEIYRGIDGVWDAAPIAVVGPSTYSFQEDLGELYGQKTLCYRINALEQNNSYGFHANAFGNDGCAEFEESIYIPNAFKPSGVNKTFKPVFAYMDYPNYEMRIYNRWAELVHLSDVSTEGWDGKIMDRGELAEPGVYLYRIMFTNGEGKEILKEGWVTLLR
jgi:gliding motility-associated-like protein